MGDASNQANLGDVSPEEVDLSPQICRLLEGGPGHRKAVAVTSLKRIFGGNARKAWSFDLTCEENSITRRMPCVMLSQVNGRQVDSSVELEFMVLSSLSGKGVRAPAALAIDASGEFVGSPSIILERLPGRASAVDFLQSKDPAATREIARDLVKAVAQLHAVDCEPALSDPALKALSRQAIAERQIELWRERFLENRLEPHAVLSSLFGWLARNLPEPHRISLVHGDLRPGNFLYLEQSVSGLLDWEMAHPGDPIEDLGWIYRPLWSPKAFLPLDEFVTRYAALSGYSVPRHHVVYYRIFSEVKFATISLTAAKAFASGQTLNIRHADRQAKVGPCLRRALDWIDVFHRERDNVQTHGR